jgi:hypothetical protein
MCNQDSDCQAYENLGCRNPSVYQELNLTPRNKVNMSCICRNYRCTP